MSFKGQSHYVMSCLLWCRVDAASKQASKEWERTPFWFDGNHLGFGERKRFGKMNFCRHQRKRYLTYLQANRQNLKYTVPLHKSLIRGGLREEAWFQESNLNSSWVLLTLLIRASPPMHTIHPRHTSLPPLSVQQCLPVPLGGSFFLSFFLSFSAGKDPGIMDTGLKVLKNSKASVLTL